MDDGVAVCAVIVDYYSAGDTAALAASLVDDVGITEIIVVDNTGDPGYTIGSLPGSATTIKAEHRQGYGAGVNLGAGSSRSSHLLVLNSDLVLHRGLLSGLAGYLDEHPGVGLVAPVIRDREGREQADAGGHFLRKWGSDEERGEWRTGAAFMIRRQTFQEMDGFDERYFMYWEDTDLCLRLQHAGLRVATDDAVVVVHTSGGSDARASSRYRNAARSRDLFLRRWSYPAPQRVLLFALARCKLLALRVRGL